MRRRLQKYDEDVDDWHEPAAPTGINIVAREVTVVTKSTGPFTSRRARRSSNSPRHSRNVSQSHTDARKCSTANENEHLPPYLLPGPAPRGNERLPPHFLKNEHGPTSPLRKPRLVGHTTTSPAHQHPATTKYPPIQLLSHNQGLHSAYASSNAPNSSSSSGQVDLPEEKKLETTSCKVDECCHNVGLEAGGGRPAARCSRVGSGAAAGTGSGSPGRANVQYQFCPGVKSSQTYLVVPLRLRRGNDDVVVRTAGAVARAAAACSAVVVRQQRPTQARSATEHPCQGKDPTGGPSSAKKPPPSRAPPATQAPPAEKQENSAPANDVSGGRSETPTNQNPDRGRTTGSGSACDGVVPPPPAADSSKTSHSIAPCVIFSAPETPPDSPPSKKASHMALGASRHSTVATQYSQHSDLDIKSHTKEENITDTFPVGIKSSSFKTSIFPKDHTQFTISDINSEQRKDQMEQNSEQSFGWQDETQPTTNILPSLEDLDPISLALQDALRLCTELQKVSIIEKELQATELSLRSTEKGQLPAMGDDASAGDGTSVARVCSKEKNIDSETDRVLCHEGEDSKELQMLQQEVNLVQNKDGQEKDKEPQQVIIKLKQFELKHIEALRLGLQEQQKLKLEKMKQLQEYLNQKEQELRDLKAVESVNEKECCKKETKGEEGESKQKEEKDLKELISEQQLKNDQTINEEKKQQDSNKVTRPSQEQVKDPQEKQIQEVKQVQPSQKCEPLKDVVDEKQNESKQKLSKEVSSLDHSESKQATEIKSQKHKKLEEDAQPPNQIIEIKPPKKERTSEQKLVAEPKKMEKKEEKPKKRKEVKVAHTSQRKSEANQNKEVNVKFVIPKQNTKQRKSSEQRTAVSSRASSPSRPPTPYYPWHSKKKSDASSVPQTPHETSHNISSEEKINFDVSDSISGKNSCAHDTIFDRSVSRFSMDNERSLHSQRSSTAESSPQKVKQIKSRVSSVKSSSPTPSLQCVRDFNWLPLRSLVHIMQQTSSGSKELCSYDLPKCRKMLELSLSRNSRPSSENTHTFSSRMNSHTTTTPLSSLYLPSDNQFSRLWTYSQSSGKQLRMHASEQLVKSFSRDYETSSSSMSSECLLNLPSLSRVPSCHLGPTGLPSQLSVARSSSCDLRHTSTDRLVEEISKELGSFGSTEVSTLEPAQQDGNEAMEAETTSECPPRQETTNQSNKREHKPRRTKEWRKGPANSKQRGRGRGFSTPQLRWMMPQTSSKARGFPPGPTRVVVRASNRPTGTGRRRQAQPSPPLRPAGQGPSEKIPPVGKSLLRLLPPMGNERWSLKAVTTTSMTSGRSGRGTTRQRAHAPRNPRPPRSTRSRSFSQPHVDRSKDRHVSRLRSNCSRSSGGSPSATTQRRGAQKKRSSDRSTAHGPTHGPARQNAQRSVRPPAPRLHALRELNGRAHERGDRHGVETMVSKTKMSVSSSTLNSEAKKEADLSTHSVPQQNEKETQIDELTDFAEEKIKSIGFRRPQDLIYHIMVEASAAADNANSSVQLETKKEKMRQRANISVQSENQLRTSAYCGKAQSDSTYIGDYLMAPISTSYLTGTSDFQLPVQTPRSLKIPGMAVNVRTEAQKLLHKLILHNAEREIMECDENEEKTHGHEQLTNEVI